MVRNTFLFDDPFKPISQFLLVPYSSPYPTYGGEQSYAYNNCQEYSMNNTAAPQHTNDPCNTYHAPISDGGRDYYNRTMNSYQEY